MSTATSVRERPIIMGADSVKAILAGQKTQTRRVYKPQDAPATLLERGVTLADLARHCPYGQPGDQLYVKEAWAPAGQTLDGEPEIVYRADRPHYAGRWQSPLFMRKVDSRLWLEIVAVRAERLQDIGEADALAEGFDQALYGGGLSVRERGKYRRATHWYAELWDSLNAKRGYPWSSNCWVWVLEFRQVTT